MLGICLGLQIATGLALAINYTAHIDHAFDSV
jgi:quinol-cytochrome oxidoreductase complex cytochrome b subunit